MTNEKKKNWMIVAAVSVAFLGLMIFNGCEKKTEPVAPSSEPNTTQETVASGTSNRQLVL